MPIYIYRDTKTDTYVEVIRSFDEHNRVPEGEEIPESLRDTEPQWEKVIGNTSVIRGPSWGNGKGAW